VEEAVVSEPPVVPSSLPQKTKISWLSRYRWIMLAVVMGIVAGAVWKIYIS
jgi:cytoskeletal protein RodZ